MEWLGLIMLAATALLVITTGVPVIAILFFVAGSAGGIGVLTGAIAPGLLFALPSRLIALLEADLLQAMPLYLFMGALLNRLPLADILFRAGMSLQKDRASAPLVTAFGLGALLGPMNGSVGASVQALGNAVGPRLAERGVAAPQRLAVLAVASTLGVVVPPSLVLILLGDAMLSAHTIAINATGRAERIINTQDVFRAAALPAGVFLLLCLLIAWWRGRGGQMQAIIADRLTWRGWLVAAATLLFVAGLLAGVAIGIFYAVEAAAFGVFALVATGLLTGNLPHRAMNAIVQETFALAGALFALLVGATTFTLVFRALGTDRLVSAFILAIPGDGLWVTIIVIGAVFLAAIVLDAFECVFVVVPILIPPLLMRVPDASWVSVLTLLTLQASFLLPPFGYALLLARGTLATPVTMKDLARELAPFLAAQCLVLALVAVQPRFVHLLDPQGSASRGREALSDDEARERLRDLVPLSDPPALNFQ